MLIEVHGHSRCPYCVKAKEWLDANGIAYTYVAHEDFAERNAFYDTLSNGQRTVPQIIVEAHGAREELGGFNDLLRSDLKGRWEAAKNVAFDADF